MNEIQTNKGLNHKHIETVFATWVQIVVFLFFCTTLNIIHDTSFSPSCTALLLPPLCLFILLCPMLRYSPADLVVCMTSTWFRVERGL